MGGSKKDSSTLPKNFEQMIKQLKTHRCAMDFEYAFCKAIIIIKLVVSIDVVLITFIGESSRDNERCSDAPSDTVLPLKRRASFICA